MDKHKREGERKAKETHLVLINDPALILIVPPFVTLLVLDDLIDRDVPQAQAQLAGPLRQGFAVRRLAHPGRTRDDDVGEDPPRCCRGRHYRDAAAGCCCWLLLAAVLLLLLCWQEKESLEKLFLLLLILLLPLLPLEENVAVSFGNDTSLESCGEKEDETIFTS